jgi:hypothetical protein
MPSAFAKALADKLACWATSSPLSRQGGGASDIVPHKSVFPEARWRGPCGTQLWHGSGVPNDARWRVFGMTGRGLDDVKLHSTFLWPAGAARDCKRERAGCGQTIVPSGHTPSAFAEASADKPDCWATSSPLRGKEEKRFKAYLSLPKGPHQSLRDSFSKGEATTGKIDNRFVPSLLEKVPSAGEVDEVPLVASTHPSPSLLGRGRGIRDF